LWERHVECVLAVLREALLTLATRSLHGTEPELNRALYECILVANRARHKRGDTFLDVQVMWEARNQPTPATAGTSVENKIPDFQCGYTDHQCTDPLLSARSFVIECKRLGAPSATGWNFNARYVSDGVARFADQDWPYGKQVNTGAMIGYLQDGPVSDVLAEVNAAAVAHGLPELSLQAGPSAPLHELGHSFSRSFAESPFKLVHAWIESPARSSGVARQKPRGTSRSKARSQARVTHSSARRARAQGSLPHVQARSNPTNGA
jgi:hypothetical protein